MEPKRFASSYVVTCLYGLEAVLAREVEGLLGASTERHWCEVAFDFAADPARLKGLRVAGNVFLQFDRFRIGPTVPDLESLAARLRSLPLDVWEQRWREFAQEEPASQEISLTVARKGEHNFSYVQVEELALRTLAEAFGRRTTLDPRPLELRVDIHADWCRLLGRLTPTPLSERPYRRYRGPFETDPTLAAAMVKLSGPRTDDVFLDPFCGIGTIPIERALAGEAEGIVAGDSKPKRLAWAVGNAGLAGSAISFAQWDAFSLPFPNRAFSRIVTSPPQSDPASGRPWKVERFARLLAETLRVLQYGGRTVWLTQRARLFERALKRLGGTPKVRTKQCSWKGKPWTINTIEKAL
ncbi:MAG: hypothetical protein ACYS8L_06785 [Planctomycetota bacterium]|jgi:23S rRNA G2445 N2-methylase RlmL